MTAHEQQRAHMLRELAAAGVNIVEFGTCVRLSGPGGNMVLIHDLLKLKPQEIERLCHSRR